LDEGNEDWRWGFEGLFRFVDVRLEDFSPLRFLGKSYEGVFGGAGEVGLAEEGGQDVAGHWNRIVLLGGGEEAGDAAAECCIFEGSCPVEGEVHACTATVGYRSTGRSCIAIGAYASAALVDYKASTAILASVVGLTVR